MGSIKIISDFIDYYDECSDVNSDKVFNRVKGICNQRGTDLRYLRNLGIETMEIKQASKFSAIDDKLVVYTNPMLHGGKGKKIVSIEEAQSMYMNNLASKFIEKENNCYYKYLQIGKKRLMLTFQQDKGEELSQGRLIDIQRYHDMYNCDFQIPIFSVDYIREHDKFKATDFNQVQSLKEIYIDNYFSKEEIISEIRDSMEIYERYKFNGKAGK